MSYAATNHANQKGLMKVSPCVIVQVVAFIIITYYRGGDEMRVLSIAMNKRRGVRLNFPLAPSAGQAFHYFSMLAVHLLLILHLAQSTTVPEYSLSEQLA